MHILLIVAIVLLAILVIIVGLIAFVLISAYMAVQPVIRILGKISMWVWFAEIAKKWTNHFRRIQNAEHHEESI